MGYTAEESRIQRLIAVEAECIAMRQRLAEIRLLYRSNKPQGLERDCVSTLKIHVDRLEVEVANTANELTRVLG